MTEDTRAEYMHDMHQLGRGAPVRCLALLLFLVAGLGPFVSPVAYIAVPFAVLLWRRANRLDAKLLAAFIDKWTVR